MFPPEIISEIMSHSNVFSIKRMCLVNRTFRVASEESKVQKLIRLEKIRQTRVYDYGYDFRKLDRVIDSYTERMFKHQIQIDETEIKRDLTFMLNVSRKKGRNSIIGPDEDFDDLFYEFTRFEPDVTMPTFYTFLNHCSSIYEDALRVNNIKVQLAVTKLLNRIIFHIKYKRVKREFMTQI